MASARTARNADSIERWKMKMNLETLQISETIQKSPELRSKAELEEILPFLAKRSELLQNLHREKRYDALFELIKHCEHMKCMKDDIIVKQGSIGDCFYILLTGQTSVYIDTSRTDDLLDEYKITDDTENKTDNDAFFQELQNLLDPVEKTTKEDKKVMDRSAVGKFIMHIDAGKSFGELALLSESAERNASIIADVDNMSLLVVDRELYNRTVKERQMAEYKDKRDFINRNPFFSTWNIKFKKLLEMSLEKLNFSFDNVVVKQGQEFDGLYFVISGSGKLVVHPSAHNSQYPKFFTTSAQRHRKHASQESVYIRRQYGYAEAEKRKTYKLVELGFLNEGDVFGGLELSANLPTYASTLVCTSQLSVLHINLKNYERLVIKKNSRTADQFKEQAFQRVEEMMKTRAGESVPLLHKIYDKFIKEEEVMEEKMRTKPRDKDDTEFLHHQLLQLFTQGKMALVEPIVPDSVYVKYKSIERRKRNLSAREIVLKEQRNSSINGRLKTLAEARKRALAGNGRKARSRRELNSVVLERTEDEDEEAANLVRGKRPTVTARVTFDTNKHKQQQQDKFTAKDVNQANHRRDSQHSSDSKYLIPRLSHSAHQFRRQDTNQTEIDELDEDDAFEDEVDISKDKYTLFQVMQKIEGRRQAQKSDKLRSQHRPKSAPVSWKTTPEEDDDYLLTDCYFDDDTSHDALSHLEERLRQFHLKLIDSGNRAEIPQVAELRRYNLHRPDATPVPGGTVLIKTRPCKWTTSMLGPNTEHSHVHRYILPKLSCHTSITPLKDMKT